MPPPGWSLASRIAIRVLPSLQHVAPSAAPAHIAGVSQGCPNLPCFATFSTRLELRPLSSTGITRLPRYYGPFRHPIAPYLTVTSLRLVATTDHAIGLPVLRAFPLCACCRYYPGTVTGSIALLILPVLSAFPERVVGSACATSFSRIAQRSLALRPAHSLDHLK